MYSNKKKYIYIYKKYFENKFTIYIYIYISKGEFQKPNESQILKTNGWYAFQNFRKNIFEILTNNMF